MLLRAKNPSSWNLDEEQKSACWNFSNVTFGFPRHERVIVILHQHACWITSKSLSTFRTVLTLFCKSHETKRKTTSINWRTWLRLHCYLRGCRISPTAEFFIKLSAVMNEQNQQIALFDLFFRWKRRFSQTWFCETAFHTTHQSQDNTQKYTNWTNEEERNTESGSFEMRHHSFPRFCTLQVFNWFSGKSAVSASGKRTSLT